jgi:cell wall-associated NlpC family hydrolase
MLTSIDIRAAIVEEVESWIGTPYIKRGKIKGIGVDCGLLPYMVYKKFNLVPDLDDNLPTLEDGWFCNTYDQRYARMVERYWRKLIVTQARYEMKPEFLPGNLVLLKTYGSLVYNHAGIITDWPRVIHSSPDTGVAKIDASTDASWSCQEIAVYEVLSNDR